MSQQKASELEESKKLPYCRGFPCQPHSVIGNRKAEGDQRHLWPEFMRVIKELQPRYVLGENVNGILSTIHESICADLETEGYEIRTFSIPAYAVGAHHEIPGFYCWLLPGQARITSQSGGKRQRSTMGNTETLFAQVLGLFTRNVLGNTSTPGMRNG